MNDIASILHQFKKGLLSAEEVAEKISAGTVPAACLPPDKMFWPRV